VKTITIRLPDVEAAMLFELLKDKREYRDVHRFLLKQIHLQYEKLPANRINK